jgi:hypothetical protein
MRWSLINRDILGFDRLRRRRVVNIILICIFRRLLVELDIVSSDDILLILI